MLTTTLAIGMTMGDVEGVGVGVEEGLALREMELVGLRLGVGVCVGDGQGVMVKELVEVGDGVLEGVTPTESDGVGVAEEVRVPIFAPQDAKKTMKSRCSCEDNILAEEKKNRRGGDF